MKPVFTAADLDGVAPGGEVSILPGTLVTPLALEEAGRRGITLRTAPPDALPSAAGESSSAAASPVAAPVPSPPAEPPPLASPPAEPFCLEDLVRAVTEEVLRCLGIGAAAPPSSGDSEAVCSDCDGRCVDKCAPRARRVIDAGADRVSSAPAIAGVEAGLASIIDHTLLKPEASRDDVVKLCEEAVRFGFASVCVNPWYVPLAAERTRASGVAVCTVVGFPLGATLARVKIFEAEEAVKLGAREIDMVQNVGALKSGQDELVEADIRGVVEAAHSGGALCKVILETALLTPEEKVRAALAACRAGADFVKTSTGFSSPGATVEDVALLRATVGRRMGVKAAGGIRSLEDLRRMVAAGATRIGASASVRILREAGDPAASMDAPA